MSSFVIAAPARAQVTIFEELFEDGNTNGWILDGPDDSAASGAWVMGDPEGTFNSGEPAQPEDAFEGGGCAFTGRNPDNFIGAWDVDGGAVYLVSPVLDLSAFSSARLDYVRWYYLRDLDVDFDDYFVGQARASASDPWVDFERLDNSMPFNTWTPQSYLLETVIDLTSTVQIRFGASDGVLVINGNILEAAVDQVRVTGLTDCGGEGECVLGQYCSGWGGCQPFGNGDIDEDGDTDLRDYRECLACVGIDSESCAACNLMGDAQVSVEDATEFGQRMSGPG